MNVLDLFAGIGGFSLGLERTGGFKTVAFCEIDRHAQLVLKTHWPEVPIFDDVKTLTKERLDRDIGKSINVITGGFPCQDISLAGRGAGLSGERSGLWFEFKRLIEEIKPQYALIENVSALRTRGLDQVLGGLAEVGYDAEWHCIPASAVGAPHRRDRIWIIAYPQRGKEQDQPCCRSLGRMGREFQPFPWDRGWQNTLCELRGVDDGLSYGVDRTNTLRNAVIPQIPEMIGNAILNRRKNG